MITGSPSYHGLSLQEAAILASHLLNAPDPVPLSTVRSWLSRKKLVRSGDGRICPLSLTEWLEYERDRQAAEAAATRR